MRSIKDLVGITVLFVALQLTGGSVLFAADAAFPSKPIIFVVPTQVGGGADVQARLCQAAIERKISLKEPIVVLNKGGRAGSQEGYNFLTGKQGDPHYVLSATIAMFTYSLLGASYDPLKFIPIANLVFDPEILVTRAESPYKTFEDVIGAAKSKPGTITVAGAQVGTQDHMAVVMLEKMTGVKFRYVSLSGGGEIHRNVLGGHVDLAMGNPSDFLSSIEAGKLRALISTSSKRSSSPIISNVPTLKEKGINDSFEVWRGWFAPPGVSNKEVKFYENLFKEVMDDKDFQELYVNKNGMVANYMNAEEFSKYLRDFYPKYVKYLQDEGMLKK